jgi:hypothetical protein
MTRSKDRRGGSRTEKNSRKKNTKEKGKSKLRAEIVKKKLR